MIRWIDATIGTAAFDDPQTAGLEVLDVRSLVDGSSNSSESVTALVREGISKLASSRSIVVCCDHGVSRSNTIAAAIIAERDRVPFDVALERVQRATREARMDYGLVNCVRMAVSEAGSVPAVAGRVLLTGGSGFLGSALRQLSGDQRLLLSPSSAELDLLGSPFGLDRVVAAQRPAVIVHLANARLYQTADIIPQALVMLRNVLDVSSHHGVFVVFASTWNVLNGLKEAPRAALSDDVPCRPYGHYATSKALCEQMIDFAKATGRLKASVLRLSPVYGPGSLQPRFIRRVAEQLRAGQPAVTHRYLNGRPELQLTYVTDAARALLSAADSQIDGHFNVGGELALTTVDIAREIARVLKVPFQSREVELKTCVARITLDCSKARREWGWRPETALADGLRAVLAE